MDNEEITLHQHEKHSQMRADHLGAKIDALKGETHMSTPVNVFTPAAEGGGIAAMLPAAMMAGMSGHGGMGGAVGGGLGAGLVGGLLGGLLFGGNGLNNRNNWGGDGIVTPAQLSSAINGVTDNNNVTTILQTLGDIKASVPLAEAQVQLALAGAQNDITNSINSNSVALMQGQFAINKNVSDTTAQIIATEVATQSAMQVAASSINLAIANLGTAGLQQTFALNSAIRDDGDKTRALIVAQNDAMLNRQLATAEAALLEQRAIGRSAATEVNVSQVVNQAQSQAQAQQQQQQQLILLSQIAAGFHGLQNAIATNSNLIVGNTGATTTGAQTANPVNVRT